MRFTWWLHDRTGAAGRSQSDCRLNKNKISPRPNAVVVAFVVVAVVIPLALVALNYSRLATKTRSRGATDALMLNLPNKRFVCNFAIVVVVVIAARERWAEVPAAAEVSRVELSQAKLRQGEVSWNPNPSETSWRRGEVRCLCCSCYCFSASSSSLSSLSLPLSLSLSVPVCRAVCRNV